MGQIYYIPHVDDVYNVHKPIENAVDWSSMTNDEQSAYTLVSSDGLLTLTGALSTRSQISGNQWNACTGDIYWAYYKSVESGTNIVLSVYYVSSDCLYYQAIHTTNNTYSINSSTITAGYYESSWRYTPLASAIAAGIDVYDTYQEAADAIQALIPNIHPITYNLTNCSLYNAPTEAVSGADVVINIVPSEGYILRNSGVSIVDSTGGSVPHIVQGTQIAFTMPYAP